MSAEVSSTRLYLGNLPRDATKEDIQEHFKTHGAGNITEVKLMNGFGFIEYDDPMDARDVVPAFHGSDLKGSRLTVQFARGARPREPYPPVDRPHPRPRRTAFRMQINGLAEGTSWQDLKDFARRPGMDVVYSEVGRGNDGRGFVEFETSADMKTAVEKLDNTDFKGAMVHCVADEQAEAPPSHPYPPRGRSRSPGRRPYGGGYGAPDDYYRRPPPPRGFDPYDRRRSPRRDDGYYSRDRYRSPPRSRAPPVDDGYGPPPRRYEDPYGAPPPRRYDEQYANGYDRPPRPRSPPRGYGGYDDRPRGY